jgi:hypothetical protein
VGTEIFFGKSEIRLDNPRNRPTGKSDGSRDNGQREMSGRIVCGNIMI